MHAATVAKKLQPDQVVRAIASVTDHAHAAQRNVLMITFHYPPSNTSSGGLRPLKFGKYLPELGWQSSVLTVPTRCHESTDDGLLQQIPSGVSVHRAFCLDTKAALSIRGKYPGLLAVPDRYVSWLPSGASYAIRAVRRGQVDALLSTSPVPTAHLIGLVTKRITKVPWVADFRDPWVETEGSEVHGRLRLSVELWLERQVVRHADRILVTTRELGDYLTERYGAMIADRVQAVYNGYDEADFNGLGARADASDYFTVVHAGLLDVHYRNPEPILLAIRQCLDGGVLPQGKLRVRFIGAGAFADGGAMDRLIARLRLEGVVQTVGQGVRVSAYWAVDPCRGARGQRYCQADGRIRRRLRCRAKRARGYRATAGRAV